MEIIFVIAGSVLSTFLFRYIEGDSHSKNGNYFLQNAFFLLVDFLFFMLIYAVWGGHFLGAGQTVTVLRFCGDICISLFEIIVFPIVMKTLLCRYEKVSRVYMSKYSKSNSNCQKYKLKIWHSNLYFYGCVILLGVISFILIYGLIPLDVTNDTWILPGYVEPDIQQHYAGWLALRNSDWSFPLGYADTLGYPNGTIISFTDSIPLVGIFFKIFRAVLPETFQYFGWFILICFILQGIAASLLIGCIVTDRRVNLLGTELFILSPIFLERAFRHCGLTAHFLILFSLYIYFKEKKNAHNLSKGYWLLAILATGIHPYFLPMVFGIYVAHITDYLFYHKNAYYKAVINILVCMCMVVAFGYVIGVIGFSSGESVGYGQIALNLNGFFNPISLSNITWSAFLKVLPYAPTWGAIDGFCYLGLGVIVFGLITLISLGIRLGVGCCNIIGKIKKNENYIIQFKYKENYIELIVVLIIFFVFAVSNLIYYNDELLLEYQLPNISILVKVCNIFRASARIAWPLVYCIYLAIIWWISKQNKRVIIATVLVALQITDISPALISKHEGFKIDNVNSAYQSTRFADENWNYLGNNVEYLWVMDDFSIYDIALFTQKNNMITNKGAMNRGLSSTKDGIDFRSSLMNGEIIDSNTAYIYGSDNFKTVAYLSQIMDEGLNVYDFGNCYVIWSGTIPNMSPVTFNREDVSVPIKDYTDDNWTNGKSNGNRDVFLLEYSESLAYLLMKSTAIIAEYGNEYEITDVEVRNDTQSIVLTINNYDDCVLNSFYCDK